MPSASPAGRDVRHLPEPDLDRVTAEVLTQTHPIYDIYINRWLMYLDFYEGENLAAYVERHERESNDSHAARSRRLAYRNFCGPVVDLYAHYIFSKPITRQPLPAGRTIIPLWPGAGQPRGSGVSQEWEIWLKDVDRRGNHIDRFMADVGRLAFTFGHTFVAVDLPQVTQMPRSEAERKSLRLRPYFTHYFPTEATNWELDEDETLLWIRFRELAANNQSPWLSRSRDQYEALNMLADPRLAQRGRRGGDSQQRRGRARYRTWTRTGWALHEVDRDKVTLLDAGQHNLHKVPVIPVYYRRHSRYPFIGQSLITDISGLNKEILNLDSLINESIYQQVINILVMGRQPGQSREVVIGPRNVLEYTGDRAPYFLTPSTAPVSLMEQRLAVLRDEIYRLAKLGGGLGLTQPQAVPSGLAQAFEFNETNKMLAERADELQNAEMRLHALWFAWMGSPQEITVNYPDSFDVQSFQEQLQFVRDAKQTVRSPTFRREVEKQAVRHVLPHLAGKELERVELEIDLIADAIESFSGPVFYDPLTQEVKTPGQPGALVGPLAEKLGAQGDGSAAPPETPLTETPALTSSNDLIG